MSEYIFPKPRDWNTLEDISSDIFSYELENSNLQRYGRAGQGQNGVDIAGTTNNEIVGIQCKHHPNKDIKQVEIDKEIKKSEKFKPELSRYIIITSADRDTKIHNYILKISKERVKKGLYPIEIKFWEDITDLLQKYPDLTFRHFTKNLPIKKSENVILPDSQKRCRKTLKFPDAKTRVINEIAKNILVKKIDSYNVAVGISSFENTSFKDITDLELNLSEFFTDSTSSIKNFKQTTRIINDLKDFLSDTFFSKDVVFYFNTRISLAFLVGWIFRGVTGSNLILVSGAQIWATKNLPIVPSRITDSLPEINNKGRNEAVIILNVSRNISKSVKDFVRYWKYKPKAILTYNIQGEKIDNAAHALAVSKEIANIIKNLKDEWRMKRIHFFGAVPASLAALVGHHLNAICPINIYFMDQTTGKYILGGELNNNL